MMFEFNFWTSGEGGQKCRRGDYGRQIANESSIFGRKTGMVW
jgi:hypothetical protein